MDLKDSFSLIVLLIDGLTEDIENLVEETAESVLDTSLLRAYQRLLKSDFNDKDLHDALNRLESGFKRLKVNLAQQELKPVPKHKFKSLDNDAPF